MRLDAPLRRRLGLGLLGRRAAGRAGLRGPALRARWRPPGSRCRRCTNASLAPALFGIGTVEARRAYLIGPTTAARVLKVVVDVGDPVQAGQLLAEMDPVDIEERLSALDASIARAGSAAAAAEAQRKDALAKKDLAAINARRYADLADRNFISAGALEGRLQEQTSADAGVAAADANLAAARQDMTRLAAERAALRRQRDNARLLAPAAGVVTSRDAEPGSTVVAGQAVVKLVDPGSLWVKVRFDQGRSGGLAAGLRAEIVLRSDPARPLPGQVARVESVSDSVTEERLAQVASTASPPGCRSANWPRSRWPAGHGDRPGGAQCEHQDARVARPASGGSTAVRCASHPCAWGRRASTAGSRCCTGCRPATTVVVYSEKELGADSRIKVVEPSPAASHDQPGRPRHPAFVGQVRAHRPGPGPADRRHAVHGRRLPRHGRRRARAARQQRRRPVGGAAGHAGAVRGVLEPARRCRAQHARPARRGACRQCHLPDDAGAPRGATEVRAMVVGFEPGQPGEPGYLVAGRHITRSHYEAVADVRTGSGWATASASGATTTPWSG